MAHFAKIGLNGLVLNVVVVSNNDILNADNIEDESVGQNFLENLFGWPAEMWIKTSYNTKEGKYYNNDNTLGDQSKAFRGNFAQKKFIWDEENQVFWPSKPFSSWVKDFSNFCWKAPIDYPNKLPNNENFITIPISYIDKINNRFLYWEEDLYNSNSNKGWKFFNYNNTYTWDKNILEWVIDN